MVDSRTGLVHDYSRRRGVLEARLILPGGRTRYDQATFWCAVEHHHRRKDAVLAREVVVALPAELDAASRAELAWQLAHAIADRYEVAVDCALHEPVKEAADARNHHAHLLMTACHVASSGQLGKKALELDPIHCRRAGVEDSVTWLRPRWEEMVNAALARARSNARVSHRSHRARGNFEVPSVHVGIGAGALARRRLNARRMRLNEEAKQTALAMSLLLDERRRLAKHAPIPIPIRHARRRRGA